MLWTLAAYPSRLVPVTLLTAMLLLSGTGRVLCVQPDGHTRVESSSPLLRCAAGEGPCEHADHTGHAHTEIVAGGDTCTDFLLADSVTLRTPRHAEVAGSVGAPCAYLPFDISHAPGFRPDASHTSRARANVLSLSLRSTVLLI